MKRIISMVLAVMMILTLFPVNSIYASGMYDVDVVSSAGIDVKNTITFIYKGSILKTVPVKRNHNTNQLINIMNYVPEGYLIDTDYCHAYIVNDMLNSKNNESKKITGQTFTVKSKAIYVNLAINLKMEPSYKSSNAIVNEVRKERLEMVTNVITFDMNKGNLGKDDKNQLKIIPKIITEDSNNSIVRTQVSREDYLKTFKDMLVQEAGFNKNLKSYTTNIAFFFSEKGALPPSKAIVNDLFKDNDGDKVFTAGVDKKIHDYFSVDYEKELLALEKSNMLNSTTSIVDLEQLIALYLYYSPDFMPESGGIIKQVDTNKYLNSPKSEVYNWPTNVPFYKDGVFQGSYNLAKDDFIVQGRNVVMENFIAAYNESYELAYNNPDKKTSGLIIDGVDGPQDFKEAYGVSYKNISSGGKNFLIPKAESGKILDFELFALSMNQARTIIAFRNNPSEFTNYINTPTAASLGFSNIDAPVTNLLYTGGVANEKGTDYSEYSGYYVKPYDDDEPLGHVRRLLEVSPIKGDGMYLEEIIDENMQSMLVDSIKTGIRQIDDNTGARSFNPDVWFGYYNIRNGEAITNGYTRTKAWATESDMSKDDEGLFYKKDEKSPVSGETFTKIFTTSKFKELERQGKFKDKNDAFLDHIVITEFPTMYTWGQGVAIRIDGGGRKWYVDVPLAPISVTKDIEVFVEGETVPADGGAFQTNVRLRFDNMPYLPVGLASENIVFEVLGKDVEVVSIESTDIEPDTGDIVPNSFKYVQFAQHEYERVNSDKVTVKLNDRKWDDSVNKAFYDKLVTVTWKAKPTATADSKIVFTANLVSGNTWNKVVEGDDGDANLASMRADINSEISSQLGTINSVLNKYTGETLKYSEFYPETNYDNNYAMLPIKADVDLGLYGFGYKFDNATEKTTIDIYGYLNGRDLLAANGELPVEVRLDWETWDGQSGTMTKTSNNLDKAGEVELFTFNPNINVVGGIEPGGTFTVEINPRDIPKELDRTNNIYTDVEFGTLAVNGIDFSIDAPGNSITALYDGTNANKTIKAYVNLSNVATTENTKVAIYRSNGTLVSEQNLSITGGTSTIVNFPINIAGLAEGANGFRLVVNSNFNGSISSPVAGETNLSNNIYDIVVNKITVTGNPPGCFNTSNKDETYGKWEIVDYEERTRRVCVDWDDETGKCTDRETETYYVPIYDCVTYTATLTNTLTVSSRATTKLKSKLWSNDYNAQSKVSSNNLYPKALDSSGNPAKDVLLDKLGISQLKQIIRAGHGLEFEATVVIEGTLQQEGSPSTAYLDIINQVKNNTYINGDGKVGGLRYPEIKNNEGKLEQKMIPAGTEVKILLNTTSVTKGDSRCKEITIYTTNFKYEIPMKIAKAQGFIDVLNSKDKPKVPDENKWFVYINQPDNVTNTPHVFKNETTINWSTIGATGTTDCEVQIPDFNVGVYGTMFDLINAGEDDSGNDDDFWDNY